jgi:hypothetical protein
MESIQVADALVLRQRGRRELPECRRGYERGERCGRCWLRCRWRDRWRNRSAAQLCTAVASVGRGGLLDRSLAREEATIPTGILRLVGDNSSGHTHPPEWSSHALRYAATVTAAREPILGLDRMMAFRRPIHPTS